MQNLNKKFDKALDFIIKRKVPILFLSEVIGKGVPQTHEKIHQTRKYKCNDEEKVLILKYLEKYKADLDSIFKN